jgi:hypothetical protein
MEEREFHTCQHFQHTRELWNIDTMCSKGSFLSPMIDREPNLSDFRYPRRYLSPSLKFLAAGWTNLIARQIPFNEANPLFREKIKLCTFSTFEGAREEEREVCRYLSSHLLPNATLTLCRISNAINTMNSTHV